MERSRRSVPVNAKFAALAQLKALKTGEAKRSDQFQVRRGDARLIPILRGPWRQPPSAPPCAAARLCARLAHHPLPGPVVAHFLAAVGYP